MSTISTDIFGNDMAMDVKSDFSDLYGIGKSLHNIQEYILSYKPDDDDEEACAFWSALALVEWKYGLLDEAVKNKAFSIIKNHSDVHLYQAQLQNERQKKLDQLIK